MNLKIDLDQPEIQFAIQTVQWGAAIARRVRSETSVKSLTKADRSPVTLADMGIQAIAGALLDQYFPQSVLVAEETSELLQTPGGAENLDQIVTYIHSFLPQATPDKVCEWIDRGKSRPGQSFWAMDPIDGTRGFLRGGQYAIALALIREGRVVMAVLGCPNLEVPKELGQGAGILVLAERGKGCWGTLLYGKPCWVPLRVSGSKDITQARILDSMDPQHKNAAQNQKIRQALGIRPEPIPLDSQAKHVVLAMGSAEIFFRTLPQRDPGYHEKIWDVAAGAFVIEEAGGKVTDLDGKPMDYSAGETLTRNSGFLATNGFFHKAVLETLQKVNV